MTQVKTIFFKEAITDDLACHEQFENSSRLGALNDRNPDPHVPVLCNLTVLFSNIQ